MRQTLARGLMDEGFRVVSGGTDTHVMLVDVFSKGIRGKEAEGALDRARITVNKNAIPFDQNPPLNPSGIRLGSPAVTTRGFREPEMRKVAELIAEVLQNISSDDAIASVRRQVAALDRSVPAIRMEAPACLGAGLTTRPCPCASLPMFGVCGILASALISAACSTPWLPLTSPTISSWLPFLKMCGRSPVFRPNFKTTVYRSTDSYYGNHVAFPLFLHSLAPDLVHIPLNQVPLLMMEPYVVTIHDMASLLFETRSGMRMDLRRYLLRRGLLRAKRIIAVSEATRRDVRDALGIPEERISLAYNAPNPEFFRPVRATDARAAGPQRDQLERARILERYQIHYPFLLYAGNIRPQKNIPRLVEAFAVAREQLSRHPVYSDLHLIIIGDEISRHPSVRRAVIQARVERAVRFLGFVPFDTLRVFFESAAAFVFPSLYEGFGLPPLEAMASGTPVVDLQRQFAAGSGGRCRLLVNPENVFDIARGIQEVLLDEDLRRDLVAKGKIQAARFSWERTARQVLKVYREVSGVKGYE